MLYTFTTKVYLNYFCFGVLMTRLYFIFRSLNFRKTAILGSDFDWRVFLRPKIAITWECKLYRNTLRDVVTLIFDRLT